MSIKRALGKGLEVGLMGKDWLNDHFPILESGIAADFLKSLRKGYVLIPGELIQSEIEKAIAKEDGVELVYCRFSSEGIALSLKAQRYGADLTFVIRLSVQRIAITADEQKLGLTFDVEKPVGGNFLGKLAAAIAGALLSRMLTNKVAQNKLVAEAEIRQEGTNVTIDLGKVERVKKLTTKLPLLNRCVLDVVSIQGHEHVDAGIRVKGKVNTNI